MMYAGPAIAIVSLLAMGASWAADDAPLAQRQAAARKEQAELQARIKRVQRAIEGQEAQRKDAALELKESEAAISKTHKRLSELRERANTLEEERRQLSQEQQAQQKLLVRRRAALARQLQAQYRSGLSPWTALFSGEDPHRVGRDLAYVRYVAAAQAQEVRDVHDVLNRLHELATQLQARHDALDQLTQETKSQEAQLLVQQQEHQRVLLAIDSELKKQRGEAKRLQENEARLGRLVEQLQLEIAREAERQRKAEEARQAEAKRRAQEAEKARQEQAAQEAREAEQASKERHQTRPQDEVAQEHTETPLSGLKRGLPRPVPSAQVQGRFGTQRPEGGVWRGLVLRAPHGTPVRTVAAGRVVYASWLNGFGNILIIDHGHDYLTVYAYNESVLKNVGDTVRAGDVIASVGATGGQVEPGLYFEIRHQGKPVNPQFWLQP